LKDWIRDGKSMIVFAKAQKYNIFSVFLKMIYISKQTKNRNLRKMESLKEENQNLNIIVFRVYM